MNKTRNLREKGITLVALVVTIIILLILSGITIMQLTNTGLFKQATTAVDEYEKKAATETMNLKITNLQIASWAEKQQMPTLQELADNLCEDEDMQYVLTESQKEASLDKIVVGEANSIFTKLKSYPYEFEINSSLQLASVDGIKVATENNNNELEERVESLETQILTLTESISALSEKQDETKDIGKIYSNSNTVTCGVTSGTTNHNVVIASVKVPAGTYVIQGNLQVSSQVSQTGFLQSNISTTGTTTYFHHNMARTYTQSAGYMMLPNSAIMSCEKEVTINLIESNYTGDSRDIIGTLTAIKIK